MIDGLNIVRLLPRVYRDDPIGAFEVSKIRRRVQVGAAIVYCLLAAGVVFGYAALKPVLVKEGVYRGLCTEEELRKGVRVCFEQELRLNFMFTVAAVATNVCALLVGTTLDRYGPRVSGITGAVLFAVGCCMFAYAAEIESFDAYVFGYLLIALGGPFIFIPSLQLSNTFPNSTGLILALLTGAFDSSSAIFLGYRLWYDGTGGSLSPKRFFLGYLAVPALILVAQIFIMQAKSYKTVNELVTQAAAEEARLGEGYADSDEDEIDVEEMEARRERREAVVNEITELLGSKGAVKHQTKEERKKEISGVWGAMHGKSAWTQIKTSWWQLAALFTIIQMTRINYFVATIRPQYEYLLGSLDAAVRVNEFFDVALPFGGIIAVPFIGLLLDKTSTTFALSVLAVGAASMGILGILRDTWAAYANVVIFVLYRPFYYTAVSDYCAKVFGFETFGKVYGLMVCLAGLFNFSQTGLDALRLKVFRKDPRPVNLVLLLLVSIVGGWLVMYVVVKSKRLKRQLLEEEARNAESQVMPGGHYGAC